jgi:hypothetical protein
MRPFTDHIVEFDTTSKWSVDKDAHLIIISNNQMDDVGAITSFNQIGRNIAEIVLESGEVVDLMINNACSAELCLPLSKFREDPLQLKSKNY